MLERSRTCLVASLLVFALAGAADAAIKTYNSSVANGTPGDAIVMSVVSSPGLRVTPDSVQGSAVIEDGGLGTVTLLESILINDRVNDLPASEGVLVGRFGPGAFFFNDNADTRSMTTPQPSTTAGIGAHGPSSTAAGESAEWGVISNWEQTGYVFCISSPTTICTSIANQVHGATASIVLPSSTYDLGTWAFDANGDMEGTAFIQVTVLGGQSNSFMLPRGAYQGASLPALPLVGFGALAGVLSLLGMRRLGRR